MFSDGYVFNCLTCVLDEAQGLVNGGISDSAFCFVVCPPSSSFSKGDLDNAGSSPLQMKLKLAIPMVGSCSHLL